MLKTLGYFLAFIALSSIIVLPIQCQINEQNITSAEQAIVDANIADIFGGDLFSSSDTLNVTATSNANTSIRNENLYSNCSCVAKNLCDQNGYIITNGVGVINLRMDVSECDPNEILCCRKPKRRSCGKHKIIPIVAPVQFDNETNIAQYGEFPWAVAITYRIEINNRSYDVYRCGGALIHPQVVATAAHCFVNETASQLKVRAGDWDTKDDYEPYPHQERQVSEMIVHEKFNPSAVHNDILLLVLSEPFELGENINTICLPRDTRVPLHARCFVCGWGKTKYANSHYQRVLKQIEVPLINRDRCKELFQKTELGVDWSLHSSVLCAGGEADVDACTGDGGSPLVCPVNNTKRFELIGLVSWGLKCGRPQVPGAYINIPYMRKWIQQKLRRVDRENKKK